MKRVLVAINFLTRLAIPRNIVFETGDIGRSTLFFPVVGALIGLIQMGFAQIFSAASLGNSLKSVLAAVFVVTVAALITGALHMDGLADMTDGFGGGREKDRILEIMRDSLIGAYGSIGLILLLLLRLWLSRR